MIYLLGALVVIIVAYQYAPWRSTNQGFAAPDALQLFMTCYTYLFVRGCGFLSLNLSHIFLDTQKNVNHRWILTTVTGWLCIPLNLLPSMLMFVFRAKIHAMLGRRWLSL